MTATISGSYFRALEKFVRTPAEMAQASDSAHAES